MKKHLSDHRLLSYLEDDISPRRREHVRAHLRTCPTCRERLERLAQITADLTDTLNAVGEQTPLAPIQSWETIAQRWKKRRGYHVFAFRPFLRHAATLVVLALVVVGLAGLLHTLAITSPTTVKETPLPSPTLPVSPSPAPGPLPRPSIDRQTSPVSLLIMGADGESVASDEADALMLLYLDAKAGQAFLLSIPRDLYVDVPGHGQARAGSVYRLGHQDETAGGLALAREVISATLGLPVQHAVMVRFEGFVALIDAIGGVDVEVPFAIEDVAFPDGRGGRDPLSIPAGRHHFDGALALRYARTRAVPAPGFDRPFRQRQLALAVHERVTRFHLLPSLIAQAPTLWSTTAAGFETDLSLNNTIDIALLAGRLSAIDIDAPTIDECCAVPHVTPAGERVLLPQPEAIQVLVENLLERGEEP